MKVFRHSTEFDAPWSDVTFAIFNKYPNPFAKHVLQSDVLARSVHGTTLTTTRVHRKSGSVPAWAANLVKVNPVVLILEDSSVDCAARRMVTRTRNLDHRRMLYVEEVQEITPHPTNPNATVVTTTAHISSDLGWGLTGRLERFGVSRFADNLQRSRMGMLHVLASVREKVKAAKGSATGAAVPAPSAP
ncbi:hypothetical protein AMAG_14786 [Allomyces macrogynus ATCC 38327]|uniref:PRELI/MSF1 domain-containing protein n=1 Tax=Allomyces macrogynus (strain ATCC 38327) TaxID=578462 RepID=A0A0L0T5V6_ALLM3|nr:hypothetical protein AMAG_14786 [Allomyces macrogynus ATCC 38327]|eukprot:KNE69944.1 hypothetical protein AMAG_14786 [Allomyces macrogynus ATCC 38327]